MPKINSNVLCFHPTTVEEVRKEYGLDKPGVMEQAIDILHDWIQKQEHFAKKDFCREYLERVIISTKGSVERAKVRVDKMCTLRTMIPDFFTKINAKQELSHLRDAYQNVYMPKLTEDNYRVYIIKIKENITSSLFLDAFRHNVILGEYLKINDYANGVILIIDVRDTNIMHLVKEMNVVDFRNCTVMYTEGFGVRVQKLLIVSSSKVIDTFSNILRMVVSAKIAERISHVKTVEGLYDHVPKELLPEDFGGEQKPLMELYDHWTEEISSDEHVEYLREMARACTNEELRQSDQNKNEYHGMPGSFKVLSVD